MEAADPDPDGVVDGGVESTVPATRPAGVPFGPGKPALTRNSGFSPYSCNKCAFFLAVPVGSAVESIKRGKEAPRTRRTALVEQVRPADVVMVIWRRER